MFGGMEMQLAYKLKRSRIVEVRRSCWLRLVIWRRMQLCKSLLIAGTLESWQTGGEGAVWCRDSLTTWVLQEADQSGYPPGQIWRDVQDRSIEVYLKVISSLPNRMIGTNWSSGSILWTQAKDENIALTPESNLPHKSLPVTGSRGKQWYIQHTQQTHAPNHDTGQTFKLVCCSPCLLSMEVYTQQWSQFCPPILNF